ncbi:MAG: hypothetical protein RR860_16450, partial [Janthinobacterium sp.]
MASAQHSPLRPRGLRLSLLTRWTALIVTLLVLGMGIALLLAHFLPGQPWLVLGLSLLCIVPIAVITPFHDVHLQRLRLLPIVQSEFAPYANDQYLYVSVEFPSLFEKHGKLEHRSAILEQYQLLKLAIV